jgi:hypothetical protein
MQQNLTKYFGVFMLQTSVSFFLFILTLAKGPFRHSPVLIRTSDLWAGTTAASWEIAPILKF